MAENITYSPYVIAGKISQDFFLTEEGQDINNVPGGHLIYSAIGISPWEKHPGLVARIGRNFPQEFLLQLDKYGLSTLGIKRLPVPLEHRNFISFFEEEKYNNNGTVSKNVLSRYFHAGKPFPKELLGFSNSEPPEEIGKRTDATILARDVPREYLEARCVHLCPMDYISHNLLPQVFSSHDQRTITIQAGKGYMQPYFFESIKPLINGLSAFIAREKQILNLFSEKFKIQNIEDMLKILLDFGAENIVVKLTSRRYAFINRFDRKVKYLQTDDGNRFEKVGELSCFCGAYLAGLNETYDYQKAVAYGAARASLLRNDINPYNNLEVLDMLLQEKIRIMENKIEG